MKKRKGGRTTPKKPRKVYGTALPFTADPQFYEETMARIRKKSRKFHERYGTRRGFL